MGFALDSGCRDWLQPSGFPLSREWRGLIGNGGAVGRGYPPRIRIYGIIGFFRILIARGFARKALVRIRFGGISVVAKSAKWVKRNPENPDSDRDAGLANRASHPKSSTKRER